MVFLVSIQTPRPTPSPPPSAYNNSPPSSSSLSFFSSFSLHPSPLFLSSSFFSARDYCIVLDCLLCLLFHPILHIFSLC
ncbi:uncharacterized protein BO87DRAFT_239225 [Aspergillus neoniger CBS 115656]|uniref:Uncharacterized protein n=1 Tax=Aspergillus neoniger (strain CBS 115656) TaxID=1448310 RepID=A0A318YP77_ASPNB|nr:hypothetical protein BO87DRAFT_239225 [Aspergillus neoniger CBS 115656]PYH36441.1 hypothetical protein BO87DRAFT_239225 [Aspergillus neoniger CBS 115656]